MLHEYKHILDHYGHGIRVSADSSRKPAEIVADYFAGCVLMPKQLLKAAYFDGIQRVHDLAQLFDVSPQAIAVRLDQLGLTDVDTGPRNPVQHRYRQQPHRISSRPGRYLRRVPTLGARS